MVALVRQSRAPVLLPLRIIAVVYTDLFRGIPTILLVFMLGFGMPALGLQGVTNSLFFWGLVALVLSYGAYVAEVIRAGIESIHPSQMASADALGLSPRPGDALRRGARRRVRRVIPPLLNDFISCRRTPPWSARSASSTPCSRRATTPTYNFNFTPLRRRRGATSSC